MSTFDETLHPRGQAANAGQFATKRNTPPAGELMDDLMGPDTIVGNTTSESIAGEPGVTEITAEQFTSGNVVDATELKAGDQLLWRAMTDDGMRYFQEEVRFAQEGVDEKYRRVVVVETARRPSGDSVITFRATQRVGIRGEADAPVEYPPLRDGITPEQLAIVVKDADAYGSTVHLHRAGDESGKFLDGFRIASKLTPGTALPLLDASRDVQEKVAYRFIPLAGLSYDEYLKREPLRHGGRAWND